MQEKRIDQRTKVVGIGLNKTGTKTLMICLQRWGYRHKTYDLEAFNRFRAGDIESLLQTVAEYDSLEDWPWPLIFREIDERFPDCKFILTKRKNPEVWYRSLCKMAVRLGPFHDFEEHIYGYAMPHGHKDEHIRFYNAHNRAVEEHFRDRPHKLLTICWETGSGLQELADFVGQDAQGQSVPHINKRFRHLYTGDSTLIAHLNRIAYQTAQPLFKKAKRLYTRKRKATSG